MTYMGLCLMVYSGIVLILGACMANEREAGAICTIVAFVFFIIMLGCIDTFLATPYTNLQKRVLESNYAVMITPNFSRPNEVTLKLISELTPEERHRYAPWSNLPTGTNTLTADAIPAEAPQEVIPCPKN